jgi:D-alanine-D-alanine ligase
MQDYAVKAHLALSCRGMSRTDFFYGDDKKVYVIETNTIPGMTATSLFPEAAGKAGIPFSKMLDLIIEVAK